MVKYLQNRIAQSRWALTLTVIYGVLVCLAGGLVTDGLWMQFALLIVSTMMMVELNNGNALIRIYSRMISCSYLVMTTMSAFLMRSLQVDIVQITLIAFLLLILKAYQNQSAVGWTFYAFMALGIGSIVFPQLLLFVPVLWVMMAVNIMCFSPRTFFSSILGIITPYWFFAAWLLYTDNISSLGSHFISALQFQEPFQLATVGLHQWLTYAFVVICAAIGSVHFFAYSYQDRIRIRLTYEMFIILNIICLTFAIVQPQHFDCLLGMSIVLTSTIIGHFLALTHSRLSNITFHILTLSALAITIFNLLV